MAFNSRRVYHFDPNHETVLRKSAQRPLADVNLLDFHVRRKAEGGENMQDRYAGDIGDYVKFAILRSIMPGYRLGVAWWLFPDESHNDDGRHIDYLDQPEKWRSFDPELFDGLRRIVTSGERQVLALQNAEFLPEAVYCDECIPTGGTPIERRIARAEWFQCVKLTINGCNLLFLDPDNGLETKHFEEGALKAGKSVSLAELQALQAPERALVVYHHQTRMAGGHHHELAYWGERLRGADFVTVDALRASPYSARAFFFLDAPLPVRQRAERLAVEWGHGLLTWHPRLGSTGQAIPSSV